ncbi:hypothetical protein C8Q78DRAFT_344109 [Trametes maxima]|nr:hypothetical protein C8Q78DRAFT_344109 [Trametes maxima]
MTTDTLSFAQATPRMALPDLHNFFDRLATGDYHALAKELNIPSKPITRPTLRVALPDSDPTPHDGEISFNSLDSLDGYTFEPTVEGLERAVTLIRGPSSPSKQTPEDDEAFQFTFRLMIHKLYTIRDFAQMVDDVVRTSQERFQPLPADLTRGAGAGRLSFSFSYPGEGDTESFMSAGSLASPSEATLPSSPSLWSVDRGLEFEREADPDARVLKKRCLGRRPSVVDPEGEKHDGPAWEYHSSVASVESPSPSYATFLEGLPPLSPVAESPSKYGYGGVPDEGDGSSRKRRFSLLAARGF